LAALNVVLDDLKICHSQINEMRRLRDLMEKLILKNITGVVITASLGPRLSNTSSLVIDGIDGETLLMSLDLKMYSVSTGAACSSGNPEPSPVLIAMGLTRAEAQSSLRVSLGWETTEEEINSFVQTLSEVVHKLREINLEEKNKEYVG
jgi:cysteine desulfurase